MTSVIEMTHLYTTRYSFVFLRQKNVKLATQSAENWICMGKWPVPSRGTFIHELAVIGFIPGFFLMTACLQTPQ